MDVNKKNKLFIEVSDSNNYNETTILDRRLFF